MSTRQSIGTSIVTAKSRHCPVARRATVERHRPLGLGRWEMTAFIAPDDVLSLTSVDVELTLAAIYDGVELDS
jgi:hypothetical protein